MNGLEILKYDEKKKRKNDPNFTMKTQVSSHGNNMLFL